MTTAVLGSIDRSATKSRALRTTTGWPTLLGVLACQLILLGFLAMIGIEQSPLVSLALASVAGLVSLSIAHFFFFRRDVGDWVYGIIVAAYVTRLTVGIYHYLVFIHPDYSIQPTQVNFLWDYEWLNSEMAFVTDSWRTQGILTPLPATFFLLNKNAFITMYNALLYLFAGHNVLNYAVWNSLHAVYTAYIVVMLATLRAPNSPALKWIAVLAAFQPFGFISSIFWRDTVGQTWIVVAFALLVLTRHRRAAWIVVIPIAAALAFSVRQPYLIVVMVLAVSLVANDRLSWRAALLLGAAGAVVLSFGGPVLNLALGRLDDEIGAFSAWDLPKRVLQGLVGPFPWFQVFLGREVAPGAPYMIPDFFQQVVNAALYLLVLPVAYREWRRTERIDPALLFGLLLTAISFGHRQVHSAYMSIGAVLLIPSLVDVAPRRISRVLWLVLGIFIAANILWWGLNLSGAGVISGERRFY